MSEPQKKVPPEPKVMAVGITEEDLVLLQEEYGVLVTYRSAEQLKTHEDVPDVSYAVISKDVKIAPQIRDRIQAGTKKESGLRKYQSPPRAIALRKLTGSSIR